MGCQVEEQNLINLLQTVKSFCPWFPDRRSLDLEVWGKVGQKLKWHQENGTPIGHQNLLTWSLVRTALAPIHTRKPHHQESSGTKEGTYRTSVGMVAEPSNKNPLPQREEDGFLSSPPVAPLWDNSPEDLLPPPPPLLDSRPALSQTTTTMQQCL